MKKHNANIKSYNRFFSQIKRPFYLEKEEERKLLLKAKKGEKAAKNKIILSQLWLVTIISQKFLSFIQEENGLSFFDLVQEGVLGIYRAIENFDLNSKNKFSTYAKYWIEAYISNALVNQKLIRVPRKTVFDRYRLERVAEEFKLKGKFVNFEEIAKTIGISDGRLKNALRKPSAISLNNFLLSRARNKTLEEVISSKDLTPEQKAIKNERKEFIKKAFKILNEREKIILKMNFGLEGKERTLKEIGDYFGITYQRVDQIKKTALKKLRKNRILKEVAS